MIKIERRMTKKAQAATASLQSARMKSGSCNTPEVNAALKEMFYGKCYLCENKQITSYQIEHLKPHRGNADLKYDWNNLFLSCAHCNNTKLGKYDPIIDCTREDVEKLIAFRKKGYFGTAEELVFENLDFREETINTVNLLREIYYGVTPQKKMEATILRRTLRKELLEFKECVREYQEAENEEKEDLEYLLKKHLADSSPFVAFKRWLIRDHKDAYPDLMMYIG